jgi:hypothetical protein
VEQAVQRIEPREARRHRGLVRHVHAQGRDAAWLRQGKVALGACPGGDEVGRDDARAFRRQALRHGGADAGRAARHQHRLAVQAHAQESEPTLLSSTRQASSP